MIDALRQQTRDLHERAETAAGLAGPLDSPRALARLLRRWLSVTRPAEAALAPWRSALRDELGLDLAPRLRTSLLLDDLRALGEPATVDDAPVPPLDSLPRAIGALYVLEGSTLGGQLVARDLRERLDIALGNGGSFFAARGERTGPMWRDFKAAVEQFAARSPDATPDAVAAARETFAAFERAFGAATPA